MTGILMDIPLPHDFPDVLYGATVLLYNVSLEPPSPFAPVEFLCAVVVLITRRGKMNKTKKNFFPQYASMVNLLGSLLSGRGR
jgi:hypothetical protein